MTWEDYFGIGWWCLRWSVPEWMRSNFAIQGILPDLKQSLKEAAVISCSLQEPSKDAASRAQRHIHRWFSDEGWRRERKSKGYTRREISISSSLGTGDKLSFDHHQFKESIRQEIAERLGMEAWDLVWSWARSKQHRIPPQVVEILEELWP